MPDAVFAAPSERLPWLANAAPAPKLRRSPAPIAISAAVAVASIAAAGGWAMLDRTAAPQAPAAEPARTVALPPPVVESPARAEPEGPSLAERQALTPEAVPAAPKRAKAPAARKRAPAKAAKSAAAAESPRYEPRAWASGVPGRIIQLGAFRTSAQAQGEWKRVYYRYPLLRPLPPRVTKSKIRGRTYYQLQLGTFSQAHSELLCQRLRTLGEGCMVLGLRGRRA